MTDNIRSKIAAWVESDHGSCPVAGTQLLAFIDSQQAEVATLKAELDAQLAIYDKAIDNLQSQVDELVAALKGVIRVADRKTEEFDTARAAIAKAEGDAIKKGG